VAREMSPGLEAACSRPVASSFPARTSEASDGRDDPVGSVVTGADHTPQVTQGGQIRAHRTPTPWRSRALPPGGRLARSWPDAFLPGPRRPTREHPSALGLTAANRFDGRVPVVITSSTTTTAAPGSEATFDATLSGARGSRLFADAEGVKGASLGPPRRRRWRRRDGIGTECQPANQVRRHPRPRGAPTRGCRSPQGPRPTWWCAARVDVEAASGA